jgi:chromosome partitioning protein
MSEAAVSVGNVPHVIVVGNEKGGSGKTTIAMHVAVALLKAGQRVATIDLDSRQKSLTSFLENRRYWAWRTGFSLEMPEHFSIPRAEGRQIDENETADFAAFDRAVQAVEGRQDFVVIDTPPEDSYLMRLAHSMTDTLITPLNDSFIDLDVLVKLDPVTLAMTGLSHYGEMVRETRRHRRSVDGRLNDWLVVRNRLGARRSRTRRRVADALAKLSLPLAFRLGEGLAERPAYRERFPRGLTALDEPLVSRARATAYRHAQREVGKLIDALRLPINDRARHRAAVRAAWFASCEQPLELDDILAASPA